MADTKQTTRFRFWLWLVALVGVIVPRRLRADWRQEWEAELRHREALLAEWDRLDWKNKLDLLWRSTSAFWDALWLQPKRWEDEMVQDLRYAIRMLRKHKGFTVVGVITLALGIGANTALFTVFDALVLKPLPLKEPDRLVSLSGIDQSGGRHRLFSYLDYLDYRDRATTLTGLVAWNKAAVVLGDAPAGRDDLSVAGANYVFGQIVSANYFELLGAGMALGRGFLPEEDHLQGAQPVIVLSHHFWQQQFEGDPYIVGKTIRLQSRPFTVIGVTAREFIGTTPDTPAFWVPLMMRDQVIPPGLGEQRQAWLTERDADSFLLLGRLKPGVTPQQAQAEISTIAQQLAQHSFGTERKTRVVTKSSASFINLDARQVPLLVPLLLAFGLVLLIACANVANLLLARAARRQREFGVRLALGASRLRLIRQLLTESVLLSAVGGLAGLLIASWVLRVLYVALLARLPELPPSLNLDLDYRIFGITLLAAMIAGVAAGLAPALQASRPDLNATLKDEGSAFGQHLSQSRLRNGLIVTQIAVSLALLIGTGLLARNLQSAQQMNVGFDARNLLSVAINLNTAGAQSAQQQEELRRVLAARLRALPGVKSVSQAFRQPSSGQLASTPINIAGRASTDDRPMRANYNFVSPEHFETLGIRIVRGRSFTAQEAHANAPVVVISEATAQKFWPGQDAIGQHLGIAAAPGSERDAVRGTSAATIFPSYEVIGVARDTHSGWVWEKDETYLYVPLTPESRLNNYLMVRIEGDAQHALTAVRREAEAIDPRLSVVQRTSDHVDDSLMPFRLLALLAGMLGAIALLLASIGLYGVMSFVVTQRTREIGVRIALGAQGSEVLRLFLKEGMRLTSIGLAVGLAGGIGISRLLATVLIDLNPLDPLTFVGAPSFLVLVVLLAICLPARRAARVDPLVALRHE
ncbi:MAG TPA: ABC transporter permease [Blastocatellia bacterium]|nr:ABC transporter permease [Blastocatellia bacterium]